MYCLEIPKMRFDATERETSILMTIKDEQVLRLDAEFIDHSPFEITINFMIKCVLL